MASAAQIAAAQKLADEMAAAAADEDSDDAPLESLVTVRPATNGVADRDESDDEVMPTPKRRGPPTDGDARSPRRTHTSRIKTSLPGYSF